MEGSSSCGPDHPHHPTTTTTAKMVETETQQPQQLPGGGPTVPESDEATTTNPSMNGLEAHFTNGVGGELSTTNPSEEASTSSQSAPVTALDQHQPPNTQLPGAIPSTSSSSGQGSAQDPSLQATAAAEEVIETVAAFEVVETEAVSEKRVGCAHYKRRAKFVTPCCNKLYMCRYCHDEHETHYFNRKTVTQLICTECDTRQRVQAECEKCGVRFGKVSAAK